MALLEPKPTRDSDELELRMLERSRKLTVAPGPAPVVQGRYEVTGARAPPKRITLGTPLASVRLMATPVSQSVKIGSKTHYTSHFSNGGIWDWLKGDWLGVPRWTLVSLGGLGAVVLATR